MTSLAASRNTKQMNAPDVDVCSLYCPLDVTKVFKGGLVGINAAGYLVPASAGSDKQLKIVGVVSGPDEVYDNSAGAQGAISVKVDRGCFQLLNSPGTDAITQADQGRIVYAVDDQTLARTPSLGARPPAGRVIQVDSDGVWVDTTDTVESEHNIEILMVASADLSAKQFFFVAANAAGQAALAALGTAILGVLQNAPANGAIAIVKVLGKTRVISGAAITAGAYLASDANGNAKAASRLVQATGVGSYVAGFALTTVAGALLPVEMVLTHAGLIATTDG
jgi:hypothetical protein